MCVFYLPLVNIVARYYSPLWWTVNGYLTRLENSSRLTCQWRGMRFDLHSSSFHQFVSWFCSGRLIFFSGLGAWAARPIYTAPFLSSQKAIIQHEAQQWPIQECKVCYLGGKKERYWAIISNTNNAWLRCKLYNGPDPLPRALGPERRRHIGEAGNSKP